MSIDLERITNPLRLATGSHEGGSGRGCAMNALSFIQGDLNISDFPDCTAAPLARMVQVVNDVLGKAHGDAFTAPIANWIGDSPDVEYHYLTPEDSLAVLDLAWSTVGTAGADAATVAAWAAIVLSNAHAVVDEAELLADEPLWSAHDHNKYAAGHAEKCSYLSFAADIVTAVYSAVAEAGLLVFVQDAIDLWKELNDVQDVVADPVVVNEAIDRMVTV